MLQSKIPSFFFVVRSKTMRTKAKVSFLALLVVYATPVKAECGMDKPFKIYVQRSYHADNVPVLMAACKNQDSPCLTSGTIFIVSAKKVRYAILLLNGVEGKLELGESYSAFLLCQKSPMMIPEDKDGKPIAAFYVLEQRAQPREFKSIAMRVRP